MDIRGNLSRTLGKATSLLRPGSVLGIDVGTSSAKIVQLKRSEHLPMLETYGSIELGPYADLAAGESTKMEPHRMAPALLDLLSGASATAHRGGMSIALSSAFTTVIETPVRDEAQMRRIMPAVAKEYIPVPLESVDLDWRVVTAPEESRPFEQLESRAPIVPHKQQVLLVAVRTEAIDEAKRIATAADLSISFFEVEMFSVARGAGRRLGESTLVIDLGASATKVYAVDEHGNAVKTHLIPRGGFHITKRMQEAGVAHFAEAEELKRTAGLQSGGRFRSLIADELAPIFEEASRLRAEYDAKAARRIAGALLCGGGALMEGIVPLASHALGLETVRAAPFASVQAPEILSDVFAEVGPLYTAAVGLALRALE